MYCTYTLTTTVSQQGQLLSSGDYLVNPQFSYIWGLYQIKTPECENWKTVGFIVAQMEMASMIGNVLTGQH